MASRKALIAMTTAAGALVTAAAAIAVILSRPEADAYRAGEAVEGITNELARDLPADMPAVAFTDVTSAAGLASSHFGGARSTQLPEDMGPGAAWGDVDGDGDDDLFLPNFAGPMGDAGEPSPAGPTHHLYRNRGDGTFEDVTEAAGLAVRGTALGAAFADVENDGDADLLVTQFGRSRLFANRGDGTFEDVSETSGIAGPVGFWTGASWGDFDRDGDLDAYVCGYVRYRVAAEDRAKTSLQYESVIPFTLNPSSFEPERNLLFRNDGRGRFEEIAEAAGVSNAAGRSLSADWADFDEDGRLDIYVANDVSDNAMYRNSGDGTFEDVSHAAWVADYRGAMGLAVGDPDGDLDLDIFVTHWIAQENAFYRNVLHDLAAKGDAPALRFVDVADSVGLGQVSLPVVGWGTDFLDYDGDGRLDLFAANGSTFQDAEDPSRLVAMKSFLFWNAGPGRGFFDVAPVSEALAEPRVSRGAAFSDFDQDGDVDVVVANHSAPPLLLRNDGGNARSWLAVRLAGTKSNRSGLGARIEVEAGGQRQVRLAGGSASNLSQSSAESVFGLGDATSVDVLEIEWPSGAVDTFRDLPARARVIATEGGTVQVLHVAPASPPVPAARAADGRAAPPREAGAAAEVGAHGAVVFSGPAAGGGDVATLPKEAKKEFWDRYAAAQAARRRGDLAAAAAAYGSALEILPRHDDSLYWLGNCLFETDRHAESFEAFSRLVESNPLSGRGQQQLGVLHSTAAEGAPFDLEKAEARFRRALEINREESGPMIRLGEILVARGDGAEGFAMLDAAARLNPKAASALYLCGYLAWKEGRADAALEHLRRAAKALEEDVAAVKGATSEGDTQARLAALRRAALRKSLFGPVWSELRTRVDPATVQAEALDAEYARVEAFLGELETRGR